MHSVLSRTRAVPTPRDNRAGSQHIGSTINCEPAREGLLGGAAQRSSFRLFPNHSNYVYR